jgi:hypothetical protein
VPDSDNQRRYRYDTQTPLDSDDDPADDDPVDDECSALSGGARAGRHLFGGRFD